MISLLLAFAAAQAGAGPVDTKTFDACTALVKSAPQQAIETAGDWRVKGGGLAARQCLGLAQVALGQWPLAAATYELAAREADASRDSRLADFWAQSGNAWLAANDPAKARKAFDTALAATSSTPELRGEVYLDRARAGVALGELGPARLDIDKGLELVPGDPFAWYLSAALALRQDTLGRAQNDIAKAVALAPDDADTLLLAGNIAGASGEAEAAKTFYARAASAAPGSPTARAAAAALAANSMSAPATPH